MKRSFLVSIVMAVLGVYISGCAVERSVALADGTRQTFEFANGLPVSSETEAARVNMAAMDFTVGADQVQWRWQCIVTPRDSQLYSVVVHDVTSQMDLVIRDDSPKLVDGKWMGASAYKPVSSTAWLNDDKDDLVVLRFDITNASGVTHTIYQPSMMWKETRMIQTVMR